MKAKMDVRQVVSTLKKIAERFPDRMASAIYIEAQIEMTEAKRRCPVDVDKGPNGKRIPPHPGQLRNSGFVHEPERHGRNLSVTLSFGGGAVDYAVYVHENPDAHHTVGQWKYLESVLDESRPYMAERIAKRVHFEKLKEEHG